MCASLWITCGSIVGASKVYTQKTSFDLKITVAPERETNNSCQRQRGSVEANASLAWFAYPPGRAHRTGRMLASKTETSFGGGGRAPAVRRVLRVHRIVGMGSCVAQCDVPISSLATASGRRSWPGGFGPRIGCLGRGRRPSSFGIGRQRGRPPASFGTLGRQRGKGGRPSHDRFPVEPLRCRLRPAAKWSGGWHTWRHNCDIHSFI